MKSSDWRAKLGTYDWGAIESSIRGRINENIGNPPEQGSHFIREGNMSGRIGCRVPAAHLRGNGRKSRDRSIRDC